MGGCEVSAVCRCVVPVPDMGQRCAGCARPLPEPVAVALEERAAIREYDGRESRAVAEAGAVVDVRAAMFREGRAR